MGRASPVSETPAAAAWPRTHRYLLFGSFGLGNTFGCVLFVMIAVPALGVYIGPTPAQALRENAFWLVPFCTGCFLWCVYLVLLYRNGGLTFEADSVVFTDSLGRRHEFANSELRAVFGSSGYPTYSSCSVGAKEGHLYRLSRALVEYDEIRRELRRRTGQE